MRLVLVWPALALALGACAMDGQGPEATAAASAPRTVEALVARLPATLGGFRRGSVSRLTEPTPGHEVANPSPGHEVANPSPGHEVAYATANRSIAGFVQVLPRNDAPGAEVVIAELQRLVAEATTGVPTHRRLRERAATPVSTAAPSLSMAASLRCTEMEGTYGRQPVESLACVGAFGGQLVRLRVSMVRREGRMAEALELAESVAGVLR